MTTLEDALAGKETHVIRRTARDEGMKSSILVKLVASGRVVIMQREGRPPVGIGQALRTKINANIGTSTEKIDAAAEIEKARAAEKYGADTITDLSMGGSIDSIRESVFRATSLPLTTVPIYQAVADAGSFKAINESALIGLIQKHVLEGVSSVVIHAGFSRDQLELLRGSKRIMGMVSKGGSFTAAWMLEKDRENPFLSNFEEICKILAEKDVVLSLGNAMRSGCVHDAMDGPQEKEMEINAELARRANELGVQVIIEGMGGHVSADRIPQYVARYKRMTGHRPLFVAGPLPIDIGVGHDHIAGAVGGALAAGAGADYLCYITPSEHLALPTIDQVREGVIAFKIAAHIGDSIKYGLSSRDRKLAERRRKRDWEGQFRCALDGDTARQIHLKGQTENCSMCGKYCAIAIMEEYLRRT